MNFFSFLLEKLATIDYDDEFEVSEGEDSDDEPAAKRRRTNAPSRSRRNKGKVHLLLGSLRHTNVFIWLSAFRCTITNVYSSKKGWIPMQKQSNRRNSVLLGVYLVYTVR